jgi:hypothetical protein
VKISIAMASFSKLFLAQRDTLAGCEKDRNRLKLVLATTF